MEQRVYTLSDLPEEERPRERMMRNGSESLSHAELLAILLRTGTRSESAVHLAQRILNDCGGLRRFAERSWDELTHIRGIGPAKALQLQASIELGRRVARSRLPEMPRIAKPQDAADLLMEDLRHYREEHFVCLFLNTKNQVIGRQTLSIGSLSASVVHPREVFRAAIRRSSASILCAHNHPSGDPTPSPEDIQITKRLAEAGQLLGIELLDHLVIGDNRYISLKESGCL
ncbi:RadC family protein [Cohnella thailandensis]|uniref:DNA repair protein RadC n=1 Tax=Cohnella thailandensis TaxID=557557 RepID=A0A841SWB1_9BACL|nr:DNA repair protein RadC [Cohnella thailandensis]MBB6633917.1 DNA repair protein RadC [Cohnella thailandensis]MBP1972600.1 DNA repair protein RadC [Cohnella thailandensis]